LRLSCLICSSRSACAEEASVVSTTANNTAIVMNSSELIARKMVDLYMHIPVVT
jgi:hypothetical protein